MATAEAVLNVLRGWLGITESPTHSNHTPIGAEFGWNGVPWCAEGCSVAHKHVEAPPFWTASVAQAIADAKAGKNGLTWLGPDQPTQPGDHWTFDWDRLTAPGNPNNFHISTVEDPATQANVLTIGCNEEDSVKRTWRDRTYLQGIIRPRYDAPPPSPPPAPPHAGDTLNHGESLGRGGQLLSTSGAFMLVLQATDGHLVLYDVRPGQGHFIALWSTPGGGADRLLMQDDDNLVTYAGQHALWATGTTHHAGRGHARLMVQSDGNLVMYRDTDNLPIWERHRGVLR